MLFSSTLIQAGPVSSQWEAEIVTISSSLYSKCSLIVQRFWEEEASSSP